MAEFHYFNHSVSARSHAAIKAIRSKYGASGYAYYFMLLELVYGSHKPILDLSIDFMSKSIADELGITVEELFGFIDDCCLVSLFNAEMWKESKCLSSDGIVDSFNFHKEMSERGKKGGRPKKQ